MGALGLLSGAVTSIILSNQQPLRNDDRSKSLSVHYRKPTMTRASIAIANHSDDPNTTF